MLNIPLMSADIPRHRADYSITPPWRGGAQGFNDFRLSLTSGAFLPTADVSGSTTIYYVPRGADFNSSAVGRLSIPTYNGQLINVSSPQISMALSGLTTSTCYDLFVYWSNNGLTFDPPLAWSSSGAGTSTRATALSSLNGIYVKSTDTSRMYVGSFLASGSNTCYDTGGGASVSAYRYLFNAYNQVLITVSSFYSGTSNPTGDGLWHILPSGGANAYTILGLPTRIQFHSGCHLANAASGGIALWGIAFDGNQPAAPFYSSTMNGTLAAISAAVGGVLLAVGYHKIEGWYDASSSVSVNFVNPAISASWMG